MSVDLAQMMKEQAALQLAIGGTHPRDRAPEEVMAYVTEMVLACSDELHEALKETGWKTWSSSNHIHREPFVAELIDAFQFLMNLFSLVNCDGEEIEAKLRAKHQINWKRLTDGYTGTNKCQWCGRALDDTTTRCTPLKCVDDVA